MFNWNPYTLKFLKKTWQISCLLYTIDHLIYYIDAMSDNSLENRRARFPVCQYLPTVHLWQCEILLCQSLPWYHSHYWCPSLSLKRIHLILIRLQLPHSMDMASSWCWLLEDKNLDTYMCVWICWLQTSYKKKRHEKIKTQQI